MALEELRVTDMFGKLFVKKHRAFEEVLVELTEDQLIVRRHTTRAPPSGETSVIFKEEVIVRLKKDSSGSIGITLKGGAEWKMPVSVSNVHKGTAAHQSGQVHPGAIIRAVNGTDVCRMTLEEVADVIASSGPFVTMHLAVHGQEIHELEDMDTMDIVMVKDVILEQGPEGTGIRLKGGSDVKNPLRIDTVELKGAAHRCGQVCRGDILLAVNDVSVKFKTVTDVENLMRNCGRYVTLKLGKLNRPDKSVTGDNKVKVKRTVNIPVGPSGLGISISGGADIGTPIRIAHVEQNSAASATGQVHRGDKIVSINGVNLKGKTQEDVVETIRASGLDVTLVLASAVAEPSVPPSSVPQNNDELLVICSIPLCLAYITQYEPGTDKLKLNAFEVVSSDGLSGVELFCSQGAGKEAANWVEAIRSNIRYLNQREAQRMSDAICIDDTVSYVSWVTERLPSTRHLCTWTWKFIVLRSASLDIFNQPPENIQEGCKPECRLQLTEFTVDVLKGRSEPNLRSHALQLHSGRGQIFVLAFENGKDLNVWKQAIHRATVDYVIRTKQVQFKIQWNGYGALLLMDIQRGLVIVDPLTMVL